MIKCKLRILLAENDMNQADFIKASGVAPMTVSRLYRNDFKQIPCDAACKICEYFNCSIGDLFVCVPDDKAL